MIQAAADSDRLVAGVISARVKAEDPAKWRLSRTVAIGFAHDVRRSVTDVDAICGTAVRQGSWTSKIVIDEHRLRAAPTSGRDEVQ